MIEAIYLTSSLSRQINSTDSPINISFFYSNSITFNSNTVSIVKSSEVNATAIAISKINLQEPFTIQKLTVVNWALGCLIQHKIFDVLDDKCVVFTVTKTSLHLCCMLLIKSCSCLHHEDTEREQRSALHRSEWSISCPSCFTPRERTPNYPANLRLDGPQNWSEYFGDKNKSCATAEEKSEIIQAVV